MRRGEPRKQILLRLPAGDRQALESEASRLGVSMMELCRRWFEPHLEKLRRRHASPRG